MTPIEIAVPIQIGLLIGVPVVAGALLLWRYGAGQTNIWRVIVGGIAGFAAAQLVLLGLVPLMGALGLPDPPTQWSRLLISLVYGLAIGVVEEGVLYLLLRFWLRDARSWAHGLMLGVGMGGAESVFTGVTSLMWYFTLTSLKTGPPPGQQLTDADTVRINEVLASYWGTPWQLPLLSALQEICLLALAVALASLVMYVFLSGRIIYLPAAMGLHAVAVTTTLFIGQYGAGYSLAVSVVFAVLALGIVARLGRMAPAAPDSTTAPPASVVQAPTVQKEARPRKKRAKK